MASGDIVGVLREIAPTAADYAAHSSIAGGSTPGELVPVLEFDDSTDEYVDFYGRLEGYGGGGLTITLDYSMAAATTGVVLWEAAIRRIQDDAEDVGAAHTYAFNAAAEDTVPSAAGERSRVSIAFTDGADMDNLADGEPFILRLRRSNTTSGSNATGLAQLWPWSLLVKET